MNKSDLEKMREDYLELFEHMKGLYSIESMAKYYEALTIIDRLLAESEAEPIAWANENVIPLRGLADNHPCILTATKCDANTVPLYLHPPVTKPVSEIDEQRISGELWSFLRSVLSQGVAIWQDHRNKHYEIYSARLDAAARERADEWQARAALQERSK